MPREFKIVIKTEADSAGARQSVSDMNSVKEAGVTSNQEIGKETESLIVKKRDLRSAVKGLQTEFPELSHAARLAINPIAFSVAGITGAFALWNMRVRELETTLGAFELPDITQEKINHVNEAADAWRNLGDAVAAAARAFDSVGAESERANKKITKETEEEKKKLGAQKGIELAQLDQKKGSLKEGQYEVEKANIEDRYAKAGIGIDERQAQRQLAEKDRLRGNLLIDAKQKMDEAGGIRVSPADAYKGTNENWAKEKKAAEDQVKISQQRIDDIQAFKSREGSWWQNQVLQGKMYMRYGRLDDETLGPAEAQERESRDSAQSIVRNANAYELRQPGRERLRGRRSELERSAASEAAQAFTIGKELPGDFAGMQERNMTGRQVAGMESLSRHTEVQAKLEEQFKRMNELADKSLSSASRLGGGGGGGQAAGAESVIQKLQQIHTVLEDHTKQLRKLNGKPGANVPSL